MKILTRRGSVAVVETIQQRKKAVHKALHSTTTRKRRAVSGRYKKMRPPSAVDIAATLTTRGVHAVSVRTVRRDLGPRRDVVRKYRKAALERRRRRELAMAAVRLGW